MTQGTLKRGIGGVVRLRVTYAQPDGTLVAWIQNVRVANSRWSTDQQLAPEAAADPNAYLTIQFTGNATAGGGPYRGEQLGKGLANLDGLTSRRALPHRRGSQPRRAARGSGIVQRVRRDVLRLLSCVIAIAAAGLPARAIAADPTPRSMAALGDSLTVGQGAGGTKGSWSTGANTAVNSHYLRLNAQAPGVTTRNYAAGGQEGQRPQRAGEGRRRRARRVRHDPDRHERRLPRPHLGEHVPQPVLDGARHVAERAAQRPRVRGEHPGLESPVRAVQQRRDGRREMEVRRPLPELPRQSERRGAAAPRRPQRRAGARSARSTHAASTTAARSSGTHSRAGTTRPRTTSTSRSPARPCCRR